MLPHEVELEALAAVAEAQPKAGLNKRGRTKACFLVYPGSLCDMLLFGGVAQCVIL